jgi:hypothetical protein
VIVEVADPQRARLRLEHERAGIASHGDGGRDRVRRRVDHRDRVAVVRERRALLVAAPGHQQHDERRQRQGRDDPGGGDHLAAARGPSDRGWRFGRAGGVRRLAAHPVAARRGASSVERGILREDCALELTQLLARLDPQLPDKRRARVPVRRQRLCLAPGAVERDHELGAQPLAQRMAVHERLERADLLCVPAQGQLRLDELLGGGEPKPLQAADLSLSEGVIGEVGQRGTAPQRERFPEQLGGALRRAVRERAGALGEQALEARPVELVGADPDQVAAPLGDDQALGVIAALKRLPQPRDVHLEALRRGGRRTLVPELVDQPIARHELVGVQEQDGQHRTLLAAGERQLLSLVADLERAEDAEVHSAASLVAVSRLRNRVLPTRNRAATGRADGLAVPNARSSNGLHTRQPAAPGGDAHAHPDAFGADRARRTGSGPRRDAGDRAGRDRRRQRRPREADSRGPVRPERPDAPRAQPPRAERPRDAPVAAEGGGAG